MSKMRKFFTGTALLLFSFSTLTVNSANAATLKAGDKCTTPFASTTLNGKKYICAPIAIGAKNYQWILNKLSAAPSINSGNVGNGARPQIAGADTGTGDRNGMEDHNSPDGNNPARLAFEKCISKTGIKLAPRGPGNKPPFDSLKLTKSQKISLNACKALMPKRPAGDDH